VDYVGIGVSIFLIAVGAILTYAVEVETEGVNLDTVGVILMIVGAIGILLSLIFWSSWGGWNRYDRYDREVLVDSRPRRRRVIEEDI
jgi:hypothetical protein